MLYLLKGTLAEILIIFPFVITTTINEIVYNNGI